MAVRGRHTTRVTVVLGALLVAALASLTVPAAASVEGGCTGSATINGVRYTPDNDTPGNPVVIPTGPLDVSYEGATNFDNQDHSGSVGIQLGPVDVPIRSWADDNGDLPNAPDAAGDVQVQDLRDEVPFTLRGLYVASGSHSANGGSCSGFVLVKFDGPVLESPIALAGIGTFLLGLLLFVLSGVVPKKRIGTGVVRGRPFVGMLGGLLLGLSIAVLLQQFSVSPLTTPLLLGAPAVGVLAGAGLAAAAPFARSRAVPVIGAAAAAGLAAAGDAGDANDVPEDPPTSTIAIADVSGLQAEIDAVDAELASLLVVQEATDHLPVVRRTLQEISAQFGQLQGELQADHPSIKDLVELDPSTIDVDNLPVGAAAMIKDLGVSVEALTVSLGAHTKRVKDALEHLGKVGEGVEKASSWSDEVAKTAASLDRALAVFEKTRDGALSNDDLIEAFDLYMAQTLGALGGLVSVMPSFGPMLEQYAKAVSSVVKDLKTINARTAKTNEAIASFDELFRGSSPAGTAAPVDAAAAAREARIGELSARRAELVSQLDAERWRLAEGTVEKLTARADDVATQQTQHRWTTVDRIVGDALIQLRAGEGLGPGLLQEAERIVESSYDEYLETREAFRSALRKDVLANWDRMNGMEQRAFLHEHPWLQPDVAEKTLKPIDMAGSETI